MHIRQCPHAYLILILSLSFFFFFNDTATTEIYTLSLHDALPIRGAATEPARVQEESMTAINVDRAVQSFLTLVQIDSVTYEEQRIVQHVTGSFEALGLAVVNDGTGRDGAGNLLIRI